MTQLDPPTSDGAEPAQLLARVVKDEWGRLLSLLVARFRRLDLAEDALADAVAAAAGHWPTDGVPDNPAGWLMTAARRRAFDRLRSEMVASRVAPLLATEVLTAAATQRVSADPGDEVTDQRLRLVFCCAHPALDRQAASALTLRLVLGLPTADIARLFLVPEATMAARLTRAKRKIVAAGVPFDVPPPGRIPERLDGVAEIAYLAFTAGYAPVSGPDLVRAELAAEAIRLVRVLVQLLPGSQVLLALLALMLLQHARRDARVDATGAAVLLADQDRTRWHLDEIAEGIGILMGLLGPDTGGVGRPGGSATAGGAAATSRYGEYLLQALIAAEHAVAPTAADTDWARIARWYAELEAITRSPVVRLNRAVAVSEAQGPAAALDLLDGLDDALAGSHRLPAVRAELLVRSGELTAAAAQFETAISLCRNHIERAHLQRRRAELH